MTTAHGKLLSVLLSLILGFGHEAPVRGITNTSVSIVTYDPASDSFTPVKINCSQHLQDTLSSSL